jgi:hypothetical protein
LDLRLIKKIVRLFSGLAVFPSITVSYLYSGINFKIPFR